MRRVGRTVTVKRHSRPFAPLTIPAHECGAGVLRTAVSVTFSFRGLERPLSPQQASNAGDIKGDIDGGLTWNTSQKSIIYTDNMAEREGFESARRHSFIRLSLVSWPNSCSRVSRASRLAKGRRDTYPALTPRADFLKGNGLHESYDQLKRSALFVIRDCRQLLPPMPPIIQISH